jgi:hypothetical protein
MSFLAALASIIPQISQAIILAEQLFPTLGSGSSKLAHVVSRAKEIIAGAPLAVDHATKLVAVIEPVVQGIVGVMNQTGLFKPGAAAPAGTTAPLVANASVLADELEAELAAHGGATVALPASLARDIVNTLRAAAPATGSADASGKSVASAPA